MAVFAAPTLNHRGESTGIAIPLTKHSNVDTLKVSTLARNPYIVQKRPLESFLLRRDGEEGAGLRLTNYKNEIWYGTISIGTPAKSFTVGFDTGSSDLFVPALSGDENCRSHSNLWDPASSPTATALDRGFWMHFADGSIVEGNQYTDAVTIASFTANMQTIGAATMYSSAMAASTFYPDGILGLAFPSRSAYPARPLFHTLFSEGKLPQPIFSLMLTDYGGEIYVGGMNEALFIDSTLAWTPVTNPFFWELKIDSIAVNGKVVLTNILGILDTGSNFIFGDMPQVLALHQAYGGKAFRMGYYTFPCSSFPSLTFTIGGKSFLIPANDLMQGRVALGSPDCFSSIMTHEEANDYDAWTIGTIFLKRFYSVFDFGSEPPRVGFAQPVTPDRWNLNSSSRL